jgi:rhomboid protease GluP
VRSEEEPVLITPEMLAGEMPRAGGGRIDFERGMRMAPPLILVLIFANIAMFAWEIAAGALSDRESIVEAGALVRDRVAAGEVWRLISATFLHGGFDHLLGNCLVLYIVGIACEHGPGFVRTAGVYFASALGGSLLSVALRPGPSVGASGAVFGVAAAVVVFLYRHQDRFELRDKRVGIVLAIWAAYQVVIGFSSPFIDNFAHIGGLLGGAGAAWGMRPRLLLARPPG